MTVVCVQAVPIMPVMRGMAIIMAMARKIMLGRSCARRLITIVFGLASFPVVRNAIEAHWVENDTSHEATGKICTPPICGDHAEAQFQSIGERSDTLCAARVLADSHGLLPIPHVVPEPFRKNRLGNQVVDGTFEEALALAGVEIDGDDMVDASDGHQVGNHSCSNGTTMALSLGLAGVGKVGHDGCVYQHTRRLQRAGMARVPVMDLEEPLLQAEIMMRSSMTLSLILSRQPSSRKLPLAKPYLLLPLCTMKTSWSRTDVSAAIVSVRHVVDLGRNLTDLDARLAIAKLAQLNLVRLPP